jgi:hypothetical protein
VERGAIERLERREERFQVLAMRGLPDPRRLIALVEGALVAVALVEGIEDLAGTCERVDRVIELLNGLHVSNPEGGQSSEPSPIQGRPAKMGAIAELTSCDSF